VKARSVGLMPIVVGVLAAALTASGCSSRTAGYPPLATVTGSVTLGGAPVPEIYVYVRRTSGGRAAVGLTDSEGRFVVRYSEVAAGAAVGPSVVSFAPRPEAAKFPKELSRTFEVEVQQGKNNFEFELRKPPRKR